MESMMQTRLRHPTDSQRSHTLSIALAATALAACLLLFGCVHQGNDGTEAQSRPADAGTSATPEITHSDAHAENAGAASSTPTGAVQLDSIPAFAGNLSIEVNGGTPFFNEADRTRGAFEEYSPLDHLGRAGAAFALITRDTMPTQERSGDLTYKPSGWRTNTYDWVDQHYLYNRCHLIAYSLAGEDGNELNLITGTRTLNMEGMRPFEERVSSYVYRTSNSVLYRVTPVYWADNLVASGVLMEAESVEDGGAGVRFCAYCYNVEPGVSINYATGENQADGTRHAQEYAPSEEEAQADFVINKKSQVYHSPDCDSVPETREHNKLFFQGTIEQLQESYPAEEGWRLCKKCRERHGG